MEKVLLVTTIYPPQIGGPATFIRLFAGYLADNSKKVSVVCISDKKHAEMDKSELFKVYRITPGFFKITFHIRKWLILFYKIMTSNKILINGLEDEASRICILLNKKYILKIVGDRAWELGRNTSLTALNIDEFQNEEITNKNLRQVRLMMQKYVNAASLVYVPSKYLKHIVEGWGKKADDVVVINNCVPFEKNNKIARINRSPFKIIFVGRITNWKGLDLLLLAVNGIEEIEVTVCGDGPALNTYQELNRRLGNKTVSFLGRISPLAVNDHLKETDILVLPSLYEGLSHTLLEAISFGKPCLASNVGGNPEVIFHGYNGLLFNPYDHNELRMQILKLMEDREYYNNLTKGAMESSLKFNIENNYKKVEELLCKI